MDFIKNLKISHKLLVLITISLCFLLVVRLIGFVMNKRTGDDLNDMYKNCLSPIKDISKIVINSNSNNALLLSMLTTESKAAQEKYYNELKTTRKENTALLKAYQSSYLTDKEKSILEESKTFRDTYSESRNKAIKLALAGKAAEGLKLYHNQTINVYKPYAETLKELLLLKAKQAEDIHTQVQKNEKTSDTILLIVILAAFGFQVSLSLMISNMINKPISLAVKELDEGANQVAMASDQLSNASQSLASGTSEQAAAIQETSATVEETTSMVQQNNENTKHATSLAKTAKQSTEESNEATQKLMVKMQNLEDSSNEIAKIIKTIDEIAFQTNILSLNAAVEAARAGDAGKGFAVVAEEVRNLAQRSAQAAKDTESIISNNIELSKDGFDMAQKVEKSLKDIEDGVHKVDELLEEIAVATNEQAQGVSQINQAISQMEQVLQTNASTAEESASASQELSGQANSVKEIVNTLRVMVEGQ